MKNQIVYELKHPFEYANKGEQVEAQFIELSPPSFKHLQHHLPIKQAFTRAALAAAENGEEVEQQSNNETGGLKSGEALLLLTMSDEPLNDVFDNAVKLFKTLARVDGVELLTDGMLQKMSADDFENLVGEYIANFIAPSLKTGD